MNFIFVLNKYLIVWCVHMNKIRSRLFNWMKNINMFRLLRSFLGPREVGIILKTSREVSEIIPKIWSVKQKIGFGKVELLPSQLIIVLCLIWSSKTVSELNSTSNCFHQVMVKLGKRLSENYMAVHLIKLTWWKECLTEPASSFLSILELFTFWLNSWLW